MRVAWISQIENKLSSKPSIAAYTTRLLYPILKDRIDIDLFSHPIGNVMACECDCMPVNNIFNEHKKNPYDVFFYQVEDIEGSKFSRLFLGIHPGLVWFHNIVFRTPPSEALAYSSWKDNISNYEKLLSNKDCKLEWKSSLVEATSYAEREMALSLFSVCSNEWSVAELSKFNRDNNISLRSLLGLKDDLQSLIRIPIHSKPLKNYKKKDDDFCIAIFGSSALESRYFKILSAVKNLNLDCKIVWATVDKDLATILDLCKYHKIDRYEIVDINTFESWYEVAKRSHVAFHTKFGVFDNLSPFLELSLSAFSIPVVLNFASGEDYPDDLVFKIDPGKGELESIENLLKNSKSLLSDSSYWDKVNNYLIEHCSPESCALELESLFTHLKSLFKVPYEKWNLIEDKVKKQFLNEIRE